MGVIEHTPGCKAGDIDAECPCEQDAPAAPGSPTALTEQIVRLEAQLAGAVEALRFYADPATWDAISEHGTVTTSTSAKRDNGDRARRALGGQ